MTNPLRLADAERPLGEDRKGTRDPLGAHSAAPFDRPVRIIFETCREALLVVDDERHYVRVNAGATRLLGAPAEHIIGRRLEDFTPHEHWPRLATLWRQFRDDGRLEGDYEVLQGTGERRMVTFRANWRYAEAQHLIAALEAGPLPSQPAPGIAIPLTRREREILQLVSRGYSNPQIAASLFISPATVKTHLQNVYKKLRAADRASAVGAALRLGLIS